MKVELMKGFRFFVLGQLAGMVSMFFWLLLVKFGIDKTDYGMGGGIVMIFIYLGMSLFFEFALMFIDVLIKKIS